MATIYELVTQLSADPAPMDAGFKRGLQLIDSFARAGAQSLSKITTGVGGNAGIAGANVATDFITGLTKQFDTQQGALKEAFARGVLSKAQFEEQGAEDAAAFNRTLLNGIQALRAAKVVTPETITDLQQSLKDAGIKGSDAFENGFTTVGAKFRSLGRDLTQAGRELTIALTVPIAAAALAAVSSADSFEHATDSIRTTTGKVGPDLDAMSASLHNLFDTLPNSAQDIATALSLISQSTGASGSDLEKLATTALNFSRITGTDLRQNVESSQRAFEAWGTSIQAQSDGLNTLFKTSQLTGVTVSTLTETLSRFAPTLQQLGLGFGQSAALVAELAKSGVDADGVLVALQTSLSKFAARGIDGAHALQLLVDQIKGAASNASAIDLASRIFGPREATQLADAIRSGKLNIQALTDAVRASGSDIDKTAGVTDTFGKTLDDLKHNLTDASGALGESFEHAVVALAPALSTFADLVTQVAHAFTALPAPVQVIATILVGLLASVGPLALAMGGLSKAIGAVSLAIGIFKGTEEGLAVVELSKSAATAADELTGTAKAAVTLTEGLKLLKTAGIAALAIGALVGLYEAITEKSRVATKAVNDYKDSVRSASNEQLILDTSEMQKAIDDRMRQIAALKAQVDNLPPIGLSRPTEAGGNDPSAVQRKQLDELISQTDTLSRKQAAAGLQFQTNTDAANTAAAAQIAYVKSINSLIASVSPNVSVDSFGQVKGKLADLKDTADKLRSAIASPFAIAVDPKQVARVNSALEAIQVAIDAADNSGKDLSVIFDVESKSVEAFGRQVGGTLAQIANLGPSASEQLSNFKLNDTVLAQLDTVNAALAKMKDLTSADAKALLEFKKSLEGTLAAQLSRNLDNSGSFTVSVTGVITKVVPDKSLDATNDFIDLVKSGLGHIRDDAERASAATAALTDALTNRAPLTTVTSLQQTVTAAYATLNHDEVAYKTAVDNSTKSVTQKNKLIALGAQAVQQAGATVSLDIAPFSVRDATEFLKTLQDELNGLPDVTVTAKFVADAKSLHDFSLQAAKEVANAQLLALSGNAGAATAANQKVLNDLTARFQAFAKSNTGSATDQLAFKQLQADAAAAGISIQQVIDHLKELTPLGQAIKIADAFSAAATAVFGLNSALALTAGAIDTGLKGALQMKDALDALHSGGSITDNIGDLLAGGAGLVTGAIGLAQSIGNLLFGESALQKEHDQILKTNNAALDTLTQSLDRNAGTGSEVGSIAKAVAQALANPALQRGAVSSLTAPGTIDQGAFTDFLHSIGLTFGEVNAQAKALGITLADSDHNLVGLNAFAKALAEDTKLLTTLGDDLATNQKIISINNALNGKATTAAGTLADQIQAIARTLEPGGAIIGSALNNVARTLTDALANGPDALRSALKNLVAEIENGTLSLTDLGGFANVSDLLDALGTAADDLNSLAGAANNAVDALVNVPSGFKRALTEFTVQAPQTPPIAPPTTLPTEPGPIDIGDIFKKLFGGNGFLKPPEVIPPVDLPPGSVKFNLTAASIAPVDVSGTDLGKVADALTQASKAAGGSLSDVASQFQLLPVSVESGSKSVSDVATVFGVALPTAVQTATTALTGLIQTLGQANVTVPAPMFHVEHSPTLNLESPKFSVEAFPPVALTPPSVSFTAPAPQRITGPVVSVAPLKPLSLAAPTVTIGAVASVRVAPPVVTVAPLSPLSLAAPTVTLASALKPLAVDPPVVMLAHALKAVNIEPPKATVTPYTGTVSLAAPPVLVGHFDTVSLPAPGVQVATLKAVTVAAPAVHVPALASITLARPAVLVRPLADVVLAAPKVHVDPLSSVKLDTSKLSTSDVNPVGFGLPSEPTNSATGRALLNLLAQATPAANAAASANQQQPTVEEHYHFEGDILVDARTKSVDEAFDDVKAVAQKRARLNTGNSTNILSAFQK